MGKLRLVIGRGAKPIVVVDWYLIDTLAAVLAGLNAGFGNWFTVGIMSVCWLAGVYAATRGFP